jgi:quercetin dioxygenase-like cupin family protein
MLLLTLPPWTPVHALPDPLLAGWQGKPVCQRLHEDANQRILRCAFPPGVGHERHFHAPHFGYAISGGRMRITDEKGVREVDLVTGSSYSSEGTDWHEVLNVGATTTVYLIIETSTDPCRAPCNSGHDVDGAR